MDEIDLTNKVRLYYEDGSSIYVNPYMIIIHPDLVKNTELPRGMYLIENHLRPILYQEELEWYVVDSKNILHFIGYTTDEFIRENITRRLNNL